MVSYTSILFCRFRFTAGANNDPSMNRPAQASFLGSPWAGLADELVNGGIGGERRVNKDCSKSDAHIILRSDGIYSSAPMRSALQSRNNRILITEEYH
jgi:hypothetical protein